jgi:DNA-binding winged helix-turn-helix (wHTH) protein
LEELEPFLDVSGPDEQRFRVDLTKDRITIGRLKVFNDVALESDPQHLITRKVHCSLERDADGWWVIDNGSMNRTFRRRASATEMVQGRAHLEDCDIVLILGKLTESGDPFYWELTFRDPMGTQPTLQLLVPAYLEYDWIQAKLFRVSSSKRQEILDLRPQEHKLIRYMDQRNRANDNVPVMCTNEELLAAVWGEEALHTETDVVHLVWELRKKIEPNPKEPRFLETARGLGYRLVSRSSRK